MPHEIHVSERRSFRGCRRRWDWAYREGYSPDQQLKPLEFGIAFHMGMEAFYNPETWNTTTPQEKAQAACDVFAAECVRQRDAFLKATNQTALDEAQGDDYRERIDLGTGMLAYYATHVHPNNDTWFEPVLTEIPFEVPIADPDNPATTLKCLSSPFCGQKHSNDPNDEDSNVVYAGRVDLIVKDLRYGGYFLFDWKTAAQLATDDSFLQLDDQIGSYCWALSNQLNINIRGFVYAELRKDYPRPPKQLKRSSGGRSFSVDKNQPTIAEIFIPWVSKHDPVAFREGAYDDYLRYLTGAEATKFHQRFTVIKSTAELTNIGWNISLEAADMVSRDLRIYPSVGRYTCSSCAFRQPCLGTFMNEDVEYTLETLFNKSEERYYHTQPRSSDKAAK